MRKGHRGEALERLLAKEVKEEKKDETTAALIRILFQLLLWARHLTSPFTTSRFPHWGVGFVGPAIILLLFAR